MTDLFDAYFRANLPEPCALRSDTILPLDLPAEPEGRHYFVAEYTEGEGWRVEVKPRRPDLDIRFVATRTLN